MLGDLGQNEDCRPGARTSDSSEKLFQRGRGGKVSMHVIWGRGNTCNQAHIFPEDFYQSREALLVMRYSHHLQGF